MTNTQNEDRTLEVLARIFFLTLGFVLGLALAAALIGGYALDTDKLCREPISCSFGEDGGLTIKSSDDESSYYLPPEVFKN